MTGLPRQRGYDLSVPLPIFDFGDAARSRAQSTYMAAFYRAAQLTVDASSQVRENYGAYRTAYDISKHYRDEIVPLRKTIAEENVLRYNGMLIGVFELLADSREQIGSVIQAIDAQRDFWLADAAVGADRPAHAIDVDGCRGLRDAGCKRGSKPFESIDQSLRLWKAHEYRSTQISAWQCRRQLGSRCCKRQQGGDGRPCPSR